MSTAAKLADLRSYHMAKCAELFDALLRECESPIEQLFLATMIGSMGYDVPSFDEWMAARAVMSVAGVVGTRPCDHPRGETHRTPPRILASPMDAFSVVQPEIEVDGRRIRFDFAFFGSGGARVAVELDGKDWHTKPDQVARDKKRARVAMRMGWTTMRFTGSEVYQDGYAVCREVFDLIEAMADRAREVAAP